MKQLLCAFLLLLCLGLPGRADTITFIDDIELSGPNVEVLREDKENVEVKVKYGTIMLLQSRIKKIEIDFEQRLKKMVEAGEDTPLKLFQFGQLCLSHGMEAEAAKAFLAAAEKQSVAEETLLAMADFFEKSKNYGGAMRCYMRFLEKNPTNEEVKARLAKLPQGTVPPEVKDPVKPAPDKPVVPPDKPVVAPDKPVVPAPPEPVPPVEPVKPAPAADTGLDVTLMWNVEQWGNPAKVEVVTQAENGVENRMLAVSFAAKDKDKTAIRTNADMDLSQYKAAVFDAYNDSDKPLGIAVAAITMPMQYIESIAPVVQPKKWRREIVIDLDANTFKSEASNWLHQVKLENRNATKQVFFVIYNMAPQGIVYLDNIKLKTADELKALK